jgi:hypothetical protein
MSHLHLGGLPAGGRLNHGAQALQERLSAIAARFLKHDSRHFGAVVPPGGRQIDPALDSAGRNRLERVLALRARRLTRLVSASYTER